MYWYCTWDSISNDTQVKCGVALSASFFPSTTFTNYAKLKRILKPSSILSLI